MKVEFQVFNRRGLGHWMRSCNLARALRELDPGTEARIFTLSEPQADFVPAHVSVGVAPAPPSRTSGGSKADDEESAARAWARDVETFAPDLIVYDTVLPKRPDLEPAAPGARRAFVMRRSKPERQAQLFAHPLLPRLDAILVPHGREEFGHEVPAEIAERTHFVGPIARLPDPAQQGVLRGRYRLDADAFLVVSTPGGGGFADAAERFFDRVTEIHRALRARLPTLRHLVVGGPRFAGRRRDEPGLEWLESEPQLVDLLALADLVVAEGGYNTVHELRLLGVPAVFLPSARSHDDQLERVQRLADAGVGLAFDEDHDDREVAAAVLALCSDPTRLAAMRERHRRDPVRPGNRRAAELLHGLVEP